VKVIVVPEATGFQSTKAKERHRRLLQQRRQRLLDRVANRPAPERETPMITAANIHYELAERATGLAPGGNGQKQGRSEYHPLIPITPPTRPITSTRPAVGSRDRRR
jgi:hypothetical protein